MKRKLLFLVPFITIVTFGSNLKAQVITFFVEKPANISKNYEFTHTGSASPTWGADLLDPNNLIRERVVLISDGTAADSLGCNPAVNGDSINGRIAFIYRGECEFGRKSLEAEKAGAIGVIVVNNVPGQLINMGAGAVGNQVTIPVVNISLEDGALLRPYVDSGELEVFIGNKAGQFPNDLGFYREHVSIAPAFSIPQQFAKDSLDFKVPVNTWIYNYGTETQTNVTLLAEITIEPNITPVYSHSATLDSLSPGDSAFILLPNFAKAGYELGYYTLKYSLSADSIDYYDEDNEVSSSFLIHDKGFYSMSRMDPETMEPVISGGTRPAGTAGNHPFSWCISLNPQSVSGEKIYGLSFTATHNEDSAGLVGKGIQVLLYRWNDVLDPTQPVSITSVTQLRDEFFDYTEPMNYQFVDVAFPEPLELVPNTKYLACVRVSHENVYIGSNYDLDYFNTRHPLVNGQFQTRPDGQGFFPLLRYTTQGNAWTAVGFGGSPAPAIIVHFEELPVGIENVKAADNNKKAYPNPANNLINIPLNNSFSGITDLQIYDISGRIVKSETINMSHQNSLQVNTSSIGNGTYFFQLRNGNEKPVTFKVVIAH